jgi:nucleoid-associated protein YgaU
VSVTPSSTATGAVGAAGMFASMVTAYIQATDAPLPPVSFQFNPDKIDLTLKGKWADNEQPATNGGQPQWLGAEMDNITVDILLDSFTLPKPGMLIQETIDVLRSMVLPTPESLIAGEAAAPIVRFGWGPNVVLPQATVREVKVTYERFLMGVPIRARVMVTLKAVPLPAPLGATNPTSGGLVKRRTHTVTAGDSLASIAFSAYKDPNRWRALAIANGIDDPLRLRVGQVLDIPDKNTAKALS